MKFVSVGVQSPTEIKASGGLQGCADEICQQSQRASRSKYAGGVLELSAKGGYEIFEGRRRGEEKWRMAMQKIRNEKHKKRISKILAVMILCLLGSVCAYAKTPVVKKFQKGTKVTVNGIRYQVTSAKKKGSTVKVLGFTSAAGKKTKELKLPATIKIQTKSGKKTTDYTCNVTQISAGAFKNNKKLTKVTIGKKITYIGTSAFENNTNLKKVTLAAGSALTTISKRAFYGDKKLASFNFKTAKKLKLPSASAFHKCTKLKNIPKKESQEEGKTEESKLPMTEEDKKKQMISRVSGYSYTIIPMLEPFDIYFYVKTDAPDPEEFRFVDKNSRYQDADKKQVCSIAADNSRYLDVVYEDKKTGRVKGGYLFVCEEGAIDGGSLTLQVRVHDDTSYYANDYTYVDTKVRVSCPKVKTTTQYLIDRYAKGDTLFDKLDAVQSALYSLAVYPKGIYNSKKKSSVTPYPFLTTSPYAELSLNTHFEMYEDSQEYLLTSCLYPFVLHSLSFPGTMAAVAKELNPNCKVESGEVHYLVNITLGSETRSYGGAGTGSDNPVYSSRIQKTFLFDQSKNDMAQKATLDQLYQKRNEYSEKADQDARKAQELVQGETYVKTVAPGSWIRVGSEPYWVGSVPPRVYAYVTSGCIGLESGVVYSVSDVWVDGRYINKWNQYEKGAKFSDYPTADIIVRGKKFTDCYGKVHTGDVRYSYNEESKRWESADYWLDDFFYDFDSRELPKEFILTLAQVKKMKVDSKTNILPEKGFIYDGTVKPGTPFTN